MSYDLKVSRADLHLFTQAEGLLKDKYVQVQGWTETVYIAVSKHREVLPGLALYQLQELGKILKNKREFRFFLQPVTDKSDKAKLIFIARAAQKVHDTVNAKMGWFYRLCDWVISWVKETEKSKIDKVYKEVLTLCQNHYNDPESYKFLTGGVR